MASKQFVDINDFIKLAKNEVLVKTYEGFDITDPVGKGFFSITNYRFVFYATNVSKVSNTTKIREWNLNDISGISSEYGKRENNVHKWIASFLMGLAGVGIFFFLLKLFSKKGQDNTLLIASAAVLVIGFILFLFRKRKMFFIEVFTRAPKTSFISFSSTFFKSPTERIKIKPNKFTIPMIKELGTTIIEAKENYQESKK